MRGRPALLLAASAAAVALQAPPAGASELRLLAQEDAPSRLSLVADSTRFYAWSAGPTKFEVVDDHARRRTALTGCGPLDARSGQALSDCGGPDDPRLIDLATGTSKGVRDVDGSGRRFPDTFFKLGRYWLGGTSCEDPGHCVQVYLNRASAERRLMSVEPQDLDALQFDVDTPDLKALDAPRVFVERIGRYTVWQRDTGSRLELILSDGGKRRVLSRCKRVSDGCTSISFGGSLVTWAEGESAYAYRLRTRRAAALRPRAEAESRGRTLVVRHTRRSVLVLAVDFTQQGGQRRALYRADAPRP